jgi:hypothetical protein
MSFSSLGDDPQVTAFSRLHTHFTVTATLQSRVQKCFRTSHPPAFPRARVAIPTSWPKATPLLGGLLTSLSIITLCMCGSAKLTTARSLHIRGMPLGPFRCLFLVSTKSSKKAILQYLNVLVFRELGEIALLAINRDGMLLQWVSSD